MPQIVSVEELGVRQFLEVSNAEFPCAELKSISGGEQICCSLQTEAVYFIAEIRS